MRGQRRRGWLRQHHRREPPVQRTPTHPETIDLRPRLVLVLRPRLFLLLLVVLVLVLVLADVLADVEADVVLGELVLVLVAISVASALSPRRHLSHSTTAAPRSPTPRARPWTRFLTWGNIIFLKIF